jgi:DNA-binding SARP family transcriptional activator
MLEVRLIGRFDIRYDGKPVLISSRSAQSLFAYLILNAGTSYRREKLSGMFWPDASEDTAWFLQRLDYS